MRSIWNFWFIFGLFFTAIGIFILIQQIFLHIKCTEQTEGHIGLAHQFNIPYPTLTFTANGEEYSTPLSGSKNFSEGDTVTVFYNLYNIKHYYIQEDKSNNRIVGIGCTIGGIIFILAGYGVSIGLFTTSYKL